MPTTHFTTGQMMARITTVLIRNIEEDWRDAPMRTRDLMKEIGLRGQQAKEKKYIMKALYMLMAQKVVHMVKQNPKRWEIHELYRERGVPIVSKHHLNPWKYIKNIKFRTTKVPKYGPIHGEYRANTTVPISKVDLHKDFKYQPEKMVPYEEIHKLLWESDLRPEFKRRIDRKRGITSESDGAAPSGGTANAE